MRTPALRFVPPEDLTAMLESEGFCVRSVTGLAFVPGLDRWFWTPNRSINYALVAQKIP